MAGKTTTVAVIQDAPVFLNLELSLYKAINLIARAAEQGARVIAFPETWLPGYPVWLDYAPAAALWDHEPARALYRVLVENSVSIGDQTLRMLQDTATKHGVYVVMGAHERRGGTLYNAMFYFDPDSGRYELHRKLTPTYTERLIWGSGDGSTLPVIDTPWGKLAGLICWEHWVPLLRAATHARGQHFHIAQWSAVKELHQIASRHYAFEAQCFVLAAGTYLSHDDVMAGVETLNLGNDGVKELLAGMRTPENGLYLRGGSAVIAPDAEYIVEPVFDRKEVLIGELDPARIDAGHLAMDTDGHYSRPDVFTLQVNTSAQENVVFAPSRGRTGRLH